jgi:DNA polymerase-3 subunit delta'
MSWNTIIGQIRVKGIIQRALKEHSIAHAYCFYGNEGIGKEALALELAKVMNCINTVVEYGHISACDNCKSCKAANNFEHPNISLITPLPSFKAGSDAKHDESPLLKLSDDHYAEYQKQIQLKIHNPYHTIHLPNAQQIRIASIREIKKNIKMSAVQSGRRFFIVSDAEKMTMEASNAFLKTLEEPHNNITFILITSNKELLPKTILSRCQQVYCDILTSQELTQWIHTTQDIPIDEAYLIQAFAQGSITRALEFLDEDMKGMRLDIIDLLRISLKKGIFIVDLMSMIDTILHDKNRSKVQIMMHLLYLWLRDCFYFIQSPLDHSLIVNIDQTETIQKFSHAFPDADYPAILQEIEDSIKMIKRNVHMQLVLTTLLLSCRQNFLYKSSQFSNHSIHSGYTN